MIKKLIGKTNKIKEKASKILGVITGFAAAMKCKIASAAQIPTDVTPETFGQKLVDLVAAYGTPVGGAIILLVITFVGFAILFQANNPEKRAQTMGSLLYVAIAATLIGGGLFFAGIFMGIGNEFAK